MGMARQNKKEKTKTYLFDGGSYNILYMCRYSLPHQNWWAVPKLLKKTTAVLIYKAVTAGETAQNNEGTDGCRHNRFGLPNVGADLVPHPFNRS